MNVTQEKRPSSAMKNTYQVQSKFFVFFRKVSLNFLSYGCATLVKLNNSLIFLHIIFMMPVNSSSLMMAECLSSLVAMHWRVQPHQQWSQYPEQFENEENCEVNLACFDKSILEETVSIHCCDYLNRDNLFRFRFFLRTAAVFIPLELDGRGKVDDGLPTYVLPFFETHFNGRLFTTVPISLELVSSTSFWIWSSMWWVQAIDRSSETESSIGFFHRFISISLYDW